MKTTNKTMENIKNTYVAELEYVQVGVTVQMIV